MSMDSKVPEIRFEGFSGGWIKNNLGDLIDISSAARVHKEQWTVSGVPFFRTSDVVSIYKGQENTKVYISHEVYNSLSEKIGKVTKDDLLITGGGSIGIPYLVQNDNPLYFKDADLLWLKNNKKLNGYFLYTFFFSAPFKQHIKSISHTGTIAHYTIEQAKATPINTCYDEEQIQIGNYFQKLDSLISQHQLKHDKLSSIKKAMLEKMFPKPGETIPEIRFKGFSREWRTSGLSDLALFNPKSELPIFFKYVDLESVKGTSLLGYKLESKDDAPSRAQRHAQKGDVFFQTVRPYQKNNYLFNSEESDYVFSTGYAQLRPYFNGYFLLNLVQRDSFVKNVLDNCTGTSYPAINASTLATLEVSYPECEMEQAQIGNFFQKFDMQINNHHQQITKLNNIKQACLNKMFV